ncbi:MAG: RdgB/HAM1 family non-canonical purine NTP pyrophosphatase [Ignavibacteria bacterium]|nr:RdgB/HAM1 family non-canonical purine NTP pyrophosphatase [Ignavibacteria bacterium]
MKIDTITFVTGNKKKVEEVSRILNIPLNVLEADIDEIQNLDLEKIALHKLNQALELVKGPVIIDDVSVEVEAWNNFPGPLIKWLLKSGKGDASVLLKLLKGEKNRRATAKLAIGFHDGVEPHLFIGEIKGKIAEKITGKNGFGWDPVFIPEGYVKTFAQMTNDEKDAISHRGNALQKLSDFLKEDYEL